MGFFSSVTSRRRVFFSCFLLFFSWFGFFPLFLLFFLFFFNLFFFPLFFSWFFFPLFACFLLFFTPSPNFRRATRPNPPNYKIQRFIKPVFPREAEWKCPSPKPASPICCSFYYLLLILLFIVVSTFLRAPTSTPSPRPLPAPLRASPRSASITLYHKSLHF